jgi:ectoine hydroxylase-related dioxygenase (phytanoyl-CoA dioxygenase family)
MLSRSQKREFKEDGYLVLENAVDESLISEAKETIWDSIPEDRDDPEALRNGGYKGDDNIPAGEEPFESIKQSLYEYAVELVGEDDAVLPSHDMPILLNYPSEFRLSKYHHRRRRENHDNGHPPHIDGYGYAFKSPEYDSTYRHFTLGTAVYFDDVVPGGGGFTVWPGTHWIAADFFEDHDVDSLGWEGKLPAIDDDGGWDYSRPLSNQVMCEEIDGDAGTVVLYHHSIVHSNGINQSDNLRMAGFMRFKQENPVEPVRDALTNPWKHWNGMDEIDVEFE